MALDLESQLVRRIMVLYAHTRSFTQKELELRYKRLYPPSVVTKKLNSALRKLYAGRWVERLTLDIGNALEWLAKEGYLQKEIFHFTDTSETDGVFKYSLTKKGETLLPRTKEPK